ncbi:hypothetical protein BDR07DRAFT_1398422 [Suillus spraguei]|nr:hypothetical protein BDR07DRAFT_1398422 [Suillus spraguei]
MINNTLVWMDNVVNIILGVFMIARKVLTFLVVIFMTIRIANAVMIVMIMMKISGEELVLSGTYQCMIRYAGDSLFLASTTWILATVWEVLALCLAALIAVKHFRELRQRSSRSIIGKWFTVLVQTHVSCFAR